MDTIAITPYSDTAHRGQVVALWETVFGYEAAHNQPGVVIDKKLAVKDQLFLVAVAGDSVVGTVMAGYDGHRGWIYSVAVSPFHRRQGIGSRLIAMAEESLTGQGCLKINLQIMQGNESVAAFYSALGYSVEQRVSMGKRILGNIPIALGAGLSQPIFNRAMTGRKRAAFVLRLKPGQTNRPIFRRA